MLAGSLWADRKIEVQTLVKQLIDRIQPYEFADQLVSKPYIPSTKICYVRTERHAYRW